MKGSDKVSDSKLDSFQKTEKLLYAFPNMKKNAEATGDEYVKKYILFIESILNEISDEPYFELIRLKYFEKQTHEAIAEYFNVNITTIYHQRTKLVNQIRAGLFAQDFIRELYM